ncbi:Pentatricopeptide repeat [Thalictrum thalictroides]|uniref:Pentatricopeptide repeat n=1 Tax=Thalictrum thalictroides TaxID=46969 RepID=A0A7J6VPP6_THATH|nr:Pentatricopeptide repeat [Thalictrum thalictroides]
MHEHETTLKNPCSNRHYRTPRCRRQPLLIKACTQAHAFLLGWSVHAHAVKFALAYNLYLRNALIHFYSMNERIKDANILFDVNERLDVVSWNSMKSAYVRIGDIRNARFLFEEMPERSEVTWSAMIVGYVQCWLCKEALGALEQGRWVHGYMKSNGMEESVFLGNALIDMYAKSGEEELALEVFNGMEEKNLLTWTTLIKGLAMHRRDPEALKLFGDMEKSGILPDDNTFIGVFCACAHAGLVDQGRQIFHLKSRKYGYTPKIEHYGCMVDLLARGGMLNEAREMVESIPMQPDPLIWGALMAGCRFYQNVELAEYVGKHLLQLEPDNAAVYVLMSNIYVASGKQENVKKIRALMKKAGASKTAGFSLIEIRGTIHQFIIVRDIAHPQIIEILIRWEEIERLLKMGGFVPNRAEGLLDIDEEDKIEALTRHSEKLAIAFRLIS